MLLAAAAASAQPDYFPLLPGNQWLYRGSGSRAESTLLLEITRTAEFNGRTYYLLHGLPERDYWLRKDDGGAVLAYDPETGQESAWYAFGTPDGEVYRTSVPGNCCGQAVIASRSAKYKGPVGEYDYALEVQYPGVFQIGLARDLFLPWIGMIHRNQATGGPSYGAYDLIYAHVGVTVVTAPELTFGLTLDQAVYTANLMPPVDPQRSIPLMTARLTLRNATPDPIELTFPSGQSYDLVLRNEKGDVVYQWSEGKAFTMVFRQEKFGPGERNYVILVRLAGRDGKPLPQGRYTAEGWLTTTPRMFSASAGFEVRYVM